MNCTQCGVASQSLQRCAGCRSVQFCSRDCQRQHWRAGHKSDCVRIDRAAPTTASSASTPTPARATMRMNLVELERMLGRTQVGDEPDPLPNTDPDDTIYYLMIAIPSLNDRSCFGPFHVREAFVPSLLQKVRKVDPRAVPIVEEFLYQQGLQNFTLYRVNVPGPGDHKLELWLQKERNAEVKAALPCPTWKLLYSELANASPNTVTENAAQVKELEILGTFLAQSAAEAAGLAAAEGRIRGNEAIRAMDMMGNLWSGFEDGIFWPMSQ